MSAVAIAPAESPCTVAEVRFVSIPAKTPPATALGAPFRGAPLGSMTVIVPSPAAPAGALANHGRPNPLLNEIPRGRLTAGSALVAAATFPFALLMNAGLCAVYRMTAPPAPDGCG